MQDHVYVQYLELNSFQTRFRELSVSLEQVEINLREFSTSATTVDNANLLLDTLESMEQNLVVESTKARDLIRLGQDLLDDHRFAADCVQVCLHFFNKIFFRETNCLIFKFSFFFS